MKDLTNPTSTHHIPWVIILPLAAIECIVSFWLIQKTPIAGWDESVYRMNALHIAGATSVPFSHHRPPLFPLLQVIFGQNFRWIIALAHIACVGFSFLIVRHLANVKWAIFTAILFMLLSDLRYYNLFMLTELLSAALLLATVYSFITNRLLITGILAACLTLTHWQMIVILPAMLLSQILTANHRKLAKPITAYVVVMLPFVIASTRMYGHPFHPFIENLKLNLAGHSASGRFFADNDWTYYIQQLPTATTIALVLALLISIYTFCTNKKDSASPFVTTTTCTLVFLLVPIHLAQTKDVRLVVPCVPLAALTLVLFMNKAAIRRPVTRLATVVLLTGVTITNVHNTNLLWTMNDLEKNPSNAFVNLPIEDEAELIYTDLNDLAATAHYARQAIPVISADADHHRIYDRRSVQRMEIPNGAFYITWNPRNAAVLAKTTTPNEKPLYLVQWKKSAALVNQASTHDDPSR